MRIETYIPGLSKNTIEIVKHAESLGYDALVSGELNNEPFLPVLLGLEHSKKMIVRTGLAIAFPRSPMTVANMGWDLQSFSDGRFQLGLGTQVKGHNERRFSVPWSPPAPRMREYILPSKPLAHLENRRKIGLSRRTLHSYPNDSNVYSTTYGL